MSDAKLLLAAQPIEVSVNTKTAITNSQRNVRTRVNQPVRGIAMISAIR